jgi:hypothetical protein
MFSRFASVQPGLLSAAIAATFTQCFIDSWFYRRMYVRRVLREGCDVRAG